MPDDPQDVHNSPEPVNPRTPPANTGDLPWSASTPPSSGPGGGSESGAFAEPVVSPQSAVSPQSTGSPGASGEPRSAGESEASGKSGIELAREALAQAKADALKRGTLPGQGNKRKNTKLVRVREPGRGGDPKQFGTAIRELLASRGWEQRAAVGGVFGNWAGIVGPDLAEHTRPDHFEDGVLTIAADSTTWATQLRLLSSTLVRRLNEELGHGTVRRVKVVGPSSGPRRTGAWRVR